MSAREWFPFFYDDFWEDENVVGMSESAALLYLFLLSRQWKHGSLPPESEKVRRLCPRWDLEWKEVWQEVEPRFPICSSGCSNGGPADGRRRNRRMLVEQNVEAEILAKLRENGKKGGLAAQARARAKAALDQGSSKAQASDRTPTPTQPNLTSPKEEAASPRRRSAPFVWQDVLGEFPALNTPEVGAAITAYIQARPKKWTAQGMRLSLRRVDSPQAAIEAFEDATEGSWLKLYPKENSNGQSLSGRRSAPHPRGRRNPDGTRPGEFPEPVAYPQRL